MNDKIEAKKKKTSLAETPVHTIRQGPVAASIWQRQSPSGYAYYDYSLTRCWKSMSSGNTGYSKNFFSRNQQELFAVIEKATQWIASHESPADASETLAA